MSIPCDDWSKVCDEQAKINAKRLVSLLSTDVSTQQQQVHSRYVELFAKHFQRECDNLIVPINDVDNSDLDRKSPSTSKNKTVFGRIKSFRAQKLFRRSPKKSENNSLYMKCKKILTKIMVECHKEGIVNYRLRNKVDDREPKWEQTILRLVKNKHGYVLEFFSLSKTSKPRHSIYCRFLEVAREIKIREMSKYYKTSFILKDKNNIEYVIDAFNTGDMRQWLATIKYCIRNPDGLSDDISSIYGKIDKETILSLKHLKEIQKSPPQISSSMQLVTRKEDSGMCLIEQNDRKDSLLSYPWFHGLISRSVATDLVSYFGPQGHGIFIVRESETLSGEYVLTFNFEGKPKHLRITHNKQGLFTVQHLSFSSILDMLENFQTHFIPLENGGHIILKGYVMNTSSQYSMLPKDKCNEFLAIAYEENISKSEHFKYSSRHYEHQLYKEIKTVTIPLRIKTEDLNHDLLNGSTIRPEINHIK